ncbi:TonB-dependent receptor [Mucilaginibacter segetis]|uniref:TonB-dependent receptor n=1 Tax=Mucilaginibacter segetis TaxID=2793071 RepID=A0A934PRH7_9SPHI|nr:carboxypeptidase regulatory-like domain-containing protein [Mucilaginibacter segetis]MBK0378779.1 TonB-dependent receptor [Mucilaginibacter segetis]
MRNFLLILVLFLVTSLGVQAQITTSSVSGVVKDKQGGVPGATVVAVHTPTGTKYSTVTQSDGRYNIANVNVGGPYVITVSFIGYGTVKQEGIMTVLGENKKVDFTLLESSNQLSEVVVKGNRSALFNKDRLNTTTTLDSSRLASTPVVNRNITDYLRLTPQARVDFNGGISIAGQNNRYNSININGAPANDVFGLAASGTNGGQSSVTPISVDAIEQFQINVTPFDIRYNGFTGGSINAVTKSGTNTFQGGFSYYFRNQNLAGKTPTDNPDVERVKLSDFTTKYYTLNLGGPIVKDKLFLFVTGEIQKNQNPKPFNFADYTGNSSQADLQGLSDYLKSAYGYDAGGYLNNVATIDRKAFTAKLDWNINDKNHLTISDNYNNANNISTSASSKNVINFYNDGVLYPNKTNQLTAELKTTFNNKYSNNFLFTYSNVSDNRNGLGSSFPSVQIYDGSSQNIYFGTEAYSSANQLKQSIYNIINETKYYAGKHTFSLIEDGEYNKFYNLFIRQAYGSYVYSSLADFMNDAGPRTYNHSYSLVDNIAGDGSAAAAKFNTYRVGLALQDKYEVTDRFTLSLGLRADLTGFPTKSFVDDYFNNTAASVISQYYDLQGARSGQLPKSYISLSPRVAFNYDVDGDRNTQLRGGIGVFQGRLPAVWPGGIYSNSGVIIGGVNPASTGGHVLLNGSPLPFQPDVNNQYVASDFGQTLSVPSGELDLVAKNFKLPKVMKFNLALDQKLPGGVTATLEGDYTRNINQVSYYNVNIVPPTIYTAGPGSRPVYNATGSQPVKIDLDPTKAGIQNPYSSNVYLLANGGRKGYAYTLSALLNKRFDNGLNLTASYAFNRAKVINDVTSSQNSSQWRYNESAYGKNNLPLSYSDFDFGSRITGVISYSHNWFKFGGTTIGLNYYGQSGNRFSYVYKNSIINDDGTSSSNDLIYIPRAASELTFIPLTVSGTTYTPAEQAAAFDAFINNDAYLSKHRGGFAQRNGGRLPFTNIVDLHFEQRFFIKAGRTKQNFAISFDVNNFTNMLNKKWGRVYYLSNDSYTLLTSAGLQKNGNSYTPTYQFNPTVKSAKESAYSIEDNSLYNSSRWIAQIGLRYFFQ